jgi:hypothetical protein
LVAIANEGEGQWWFRCLHTDILTVQKSAWVIFFFTSPICVYL